MFLLIYVAPIIGTILVLQLIDMNQSTPTDLHGKPWCNGFFRWSGEESCKREDFAVLSLVLNRYYFAYVCWMTIVAGLAYRNRRIATYVILIENTTYFMNSSSAFFWALLPMYMSISASIPFNYDAVSSQHILRLQPNEA